jgi:hypothetical protein
MKLAEITEGVVTNIIKVEPDNVPVWAKGWPDVTKEDAEIGSTWDGKKFGPVKKQEPTNEELMREALDYLASTDWMVIRAVEQGKQLDEKVRSARAEAREKVSSLEAKQ